MRRAYTLHSIYLPNRTDVDSLAQSTDQAEDAEDAAVHK